ncbi:hypothetical protein [Tardiphaga alba]|uniref:hypothetical protein n=1 Tax=Tardiphaga alba TaxID=340268 RepID=UPI001BA7BB6B|nr:hypothetical protein [Tardiphaga alba]
MLADDFFRRIALEALGSGVPSRDIAFGIEQVDGVILDGVDQDLKSVTLRNVAQRGRSGFKHIVPSADKASAHREGTIDRHGVGA